MTLRNITLSLPGVSQWRAWAWQHLLLACSLYILTFGVCLCVKSCLGSSVISAMPLAFSLAGLQTTINVPAWSLGGYTNLLNICLVGVQVLLLRRNFPLIQLLQLVVSVVFGAMIDLNMSLLGTLEANGLVRQIVLQVAGCTIMALGVAMEVKCGSVTMAGEGVPVAISRLYGVPFAKAKIVMDVTLVTLAVVCCYIFFGRWDLQVVGPGTLFAMLYVGMMVKTFTRRMGWFDRTLAYQPGFRRYVYGLKRYITR